MVVANGDGHKAEWGRFSDFSESFEATESTEEKRPPNERKVLRLPLRGKGEIVR